MRFASTILAATLLILLTGCYSVPVTGRSALNLVSDQDVARLSAQAFEDMKRTYRVSRNSGHIEMVNRVGDRLSRAVFWDMPLADWEFVVFESPGMINAFAMAGGKVGVFSGLLDLVENEDQLASVLAHEIAHVTAKHIHERLSQEMMLQGGGIAAVVLAAGTPGGAMAASAVNNVYGLGAGLQARSFDRAKEKEADYVGLFYMARAGYNPEEALRFLEIMENKVGNRQTPPVWLSTHPPFPDRMTQLNNIMPRALEIYESTTQHSAHTVVQ